MKYIFYIQTLLFCTLLLNTSCTDGTDVEQLYEEQFVPTIATHTGTIIQRANSIYVSMAYEYKYKIKEIDYYVNTDKDSAMNMLCEKKVITEFNSGIKLTGLDPNTRYYCKMVIIDKNDISRFGAAFYDETRSLTVNIYNRASTTIEFSYVEPQTILGCDVGYDRELSSASQATAICTDAGGKGTLEFTTDTILPRQTCYLRPFISSCGHITHWNTYPFNFNNFELSASAVTSPGITTITVSTNSNKSANFKTGFYLAKHTITDDDLGTRYDLTPATGTKTEQQIPDLEPGSTYFVRPFAERSGRHTLFDEVSFTAK